MKINDVNIELKFYNNDMIWYIIVQSYGYALKLYDNYKMKFDIGICLISWFISALLGTIVVYNKKTLST